MPRLRHAVSLTVLLLLTFAIAGSAPAGSALGGPHGSPAFVPGEVLVGFQPGSRALEKASARAQLNALRVRTFRSGAEHWKLPAGLDVDQAIARLAHNPHVRYAEPNYIVTNQVVPNDPRLGEMYGLINTGQSGGTADADIDAELAWGVSTGSSNVIVGVIDTGCDYNHPDLAANIWTNTGEIPGNSIDDDNNGFVDDVHGYDFYNNDADPFDDNGHGSHTSGTIGAVGNNGVGVVGVNWNVKIMCLKFLSSGGSGSTAGAIAAVDYSVMMGVDLTSNSWGGGGFSQALYDSIAAAGASEQAFVAAAGNSGVNTDTSPQYPSAYDLANIISVAATDRNDALASFSNYGATTVDLGAPGVDILSTLPGNSYGTLSGTSMATPHVAGVGALVRAVAPNIPVAQLKAAIMSHTDAKPSLAGRCVTGGRLNAFFAIATPDTDPPSAVNDLATNYPGSNTMGLSWTAPAEDGSTQTGTTAFYEVRYSTSLIDANNFSLATRAGNEPNPLAPGTPQSMEVHGLATSTVYYFAIEAFDEWGNAGSISNIAIDMTLPPPTVGWTPTSITEDLLTGETADHTVTLTNTGVGTLDFTIPTPSVGEPFIAPQDPMILGKDDPDPRQGDPVNLGAGGPDSFGYRWVDSDQAGGPTFSWTDISSTGTPIAVTGDDATSAPVALSFNFPFYGTFFNSIRACTNGFLSLTDTSTAYTNQPLPNSGAPANLVAPFWDDLNPGTTQRIFFQDFGNRAIVQWQAVPPYSGTGTYTFQAILEQGGVVTYQYLSMSGAVNSATVGIQNASKTTGLQVAFNQAYIHDNLAVRISAIPQWLTVTPASGRLGPNDSVLLHVHLDAAGLEGGHYPGQVNIQTNDPMTPSALVDVLLHVVGAPDAAVQPAALAYGTVFQGLPNNLTLTVANIGTDTLIVTGIGSSHLGELVPAPSSFSVPPHGSQNVTVTWTPAALGPFSGALTASSNAAGNPMIIVPVTGDAVAPPVVVADPTSLEETLFSNQTLTLPLVITNAGGSNLILTAAADQGPGGNGLVVSDPTAQGSGGPDAFGYRWKDSDASGGPTFAWEDISATGTPITLTGDDVSSSMISMGMTFPLYGNNFTSFRVCTNGFVSFTSGTTCPFTNGTLFSTSLPTNSIAMFWDDLVFRTASGTIPRTSRAFWKNDGTKVIVQYKNVYRIGNSTTDNLNFEVFLYPSGKIVLQYETMTTATLNSETIGIQGLASPNFLQVIANAAYMHNNLAIQISKVPDWLTVTPAGATIPPGGSQTFSVKFDSTSRSGGTLTGAVRLGTNIPAQPTVNVPAVLHVIGVPTAAVVPTSFNYGTVYTGYSHITSFQVVNNGTDLLNVTNVDTTDASLAAEEPPGSGGAPLAAFPLAPGASRLFSLRWSPMPPGGPLSANVRIYSDDPVNPILLMPITGNAIQPPVTYWTPPSFTEDLMVGDVVNETLHVENHGLSNLTFSTAVRALGTTPPDVYDELKLDKDEIDPRPGILGSGGPDLFGYRWKDSDAPGGPTFAWTDISGIGTPIASLTGDDQNSGAIPIGFAFPFYGTSFTDVRVVTNGWLSFTSTATSFSNQALPNSGSGVPENLIAAFWDDLDFRSAQHAYYYNDGTRFIVQWNHVDHHSAVGSADLTFQAILHPNGRIVMQYLTMTGLTNSATIGFQNSTRNDGQTVVFNAAYVHNSLAIQISPPLDFIQVSPSSGTIPPSGTPVDLNVRIDTSNLIGGDYAASVDLITNDPANGLISVPVYLHVTGIPDINVAPLSLTFPTTFVGFSSSLPVTIKNTGTDVLHITGAPVTGDFTFTGFTPPVSLPVNGTIPVTVMFAPTTSGTRNGTLTIASDDPDENPVVVTLQGEGLFPPIAGVSPAGISTALPPGGSRDKTVEVCNTGGSDLNWSMGTNILSGTVTPGDYLPLAKDEADPRVGILGSGGPDLFGYVWKDSDDPNGPAFSWTDISAIGTPIPITGDDNNSGPIAIGFPFPFYGGSFSNVRVVTNGWISFTSSATTFTNQPLPNSGTGVPENLLAPYWDDLHFRGAVHATYYNDGARFIVQYTNVDRFSTTELPSPAHLTFQVILYPSGKIVYQYLTMTGFLTSATIGIQNAARDDGLNVIFNAPYMHDNLAIEIKPIPHWLNVAPSGGTVPAGGCRSATATLNAAGLDDGVHSARIQVASNDPYTPLVTVPVTLNVGLVAPISVEFDPDVLNLSSNGQAVKVVIELPAGLDPRDVPASSLTLNDVDVFVHHTSIQSDSDGDGLDELVIKFDRGEAEAVLGEGAAVIVTVQGEVADVQWWRGSTTIRTLKPLVMGPSAGEYFVEGGVVPIRWSGPSWTSPVQYTVQLSRDGGSTWEQIAAGLSGTSLDWAATSPATMNARVRVLAFDNQGLLGYGTNDGAFTLAGSSLQPPYAVDGSTMEVNWDGALLTIQWKTPPSDLTHGPADRYRVLRGTDPRGPMSEAAVVTATYFSDAGAAPAAGGAVFYRIVAANAGGDAH